MSSPPPSSSQKDRIPWWMPGESTGLRVGVFAALCVAALLALLAATYTVWRWRKWMRWQQMSQSQQRNSLQSPGKPLDGKQGNPSLHSAPLPAEANGHVDGPLGSVSGLNPTDTGAAPASAASTKSRDGHPEQVPLISQHPRPETGGAAAQQHPDQHLQLSERPAGTATSNDGPANSPGAPPPLGVAESPAASAREHRTAHLLAGSPAARPSDGNAGQGRRRDGACEGEGASNTPGSPDMLCGSSRARASAELDSTREAGPRDGSSCAAGDGAAYCAAAAGSGDGEGAWRSEPVSLLSPAPTAAFQACSPDHRSRAGVGDGGVRAVRALFESYHQRDVESRLRQAVFGSLAAASEISADAGTGGSGLDGGLRPPLTAHQAGAAASRQALPGPSQTQAPTASACAGMAAAAVGGHDNCPHNHDHVLHGWPPTGRGAEGLPGQDTVTARDLLIGRARHRPRLWLQLQPQAPSPVASPGAGSRTAPVPPQPNFPQQHPGDQADQAALADRLQVRDEGAQLVAGNAVHSGPAVPTGEGQAADAEAPTVAQQHPHLRQEGELGGGAAARLHAAPDSGGAKQLSGEHAAGLGDWAGAERYPAAQPTRAGGHSGDSLDGGGSRDLREVSFAFVPLQPAAFGTVASAGAEVDMPPPPTPSAGPAAAWASAVATPVSGASGGGGSPRGAASLQIASHQAAARPASGPVSPYARTIYQTASPGAPPLAVAAVLACLRPVAGDTGPNGGAQLSVPSEAAPVGVHQQHSHTPSAPPPLLNHQPAAASPTAGLLPQVVHLLPRPLSPRQPSDSSGSTDLLLRLRQQQHQQQALLLQRSPLYRSGCSPDGGGDSPYQVADTRAGASPATLPSCVATAATAATPEVAAAAPSLPPQLAQLLSLERVRRHPEHSEAGPASPSARGRSDTCAGGTIGGGSGNGNGSGAPFPARWQASYMAAARAAARSGEGGGSGSGTSPLRGGGQSNAAASVVAALSEPAASVELELDAAAGDRLRPSAVSTVATAAPAARADGRAPPGAGAWRGSGSGDLQLQWQQWLHDPGVREAPGWPAGWQHSGDVAEQHAHTLAQHAQRLMAQQSQPQPLVAQSWPASGAAGPAEGPLTSAVVERLMIVNPLFGSGAGGVGGASGGGGGGAALDATGTAGSGGLLGAP